MSYDIGIPAFNEERNIANLLTNIFNQEKNENYTLKSIIIVSSGSTDRTVEIVNRIAKDKPFVKLIIEDERKGQASAYNLILKNSIADYVVIMDADIRLFENSINELLKLINHEGIGAVGGHSLPILYSNHFMNNISMIFYCFHNLFSILYQPKISGKFFALKNGIIKKIPLNINCSDAYIQILTDLKNFTIKYSKIATIIAVPPQTITEFIKEQRRIYTGHFQLQKITGQMTKTTSFIYLLKLIIKSFRYFIIKKKIHYLLAFIFLKLISNCLSYYDVIRGNYRPIWEVIESTKKVELKNVKLKLKNQ